MSTLGTSTEPGNETVDQASYEAEMIAKAEGAEAKSLEKDSDQFSQESTDGEQLLAGKYKSAEDLEKAYKELEAKLGNKEETPKEGIDYSNLSDEELDAIIAGDTTPTSETEAKEVVESKGIDFSSLNQEYADNGELSPATYKRLAEAGIDEAAVNSYIAGQEALAQQNISKLHSTVGGEQSFNEMIEWAKDNLSDSEKNSFNSMVTNEASAEFAIKGLFARYKAEAEPRLLDGNVGATSNRGYMSQREMTREMADPRYKTDPAFRKMVEMKVARSKF